MKAAVSLGDRGSGVSLLIAQFHVRIGYALAGGVYDRAAHDDVIAQELETAETAAECGKDGDIEEKVEIQEASRRTTQVVMAVASWPTPDSSCSVVVAGI